MRELDLGPCVLHTDKEKAYFSRFSGGVGCVTYPIDKETAEEVVRILQEWLDNNDSKD